MKLLCTTETGVVGGLLVLLVNNLAREGLIFGFLVTLCCNSPRTAAFCSWSTKLSACFLFFSFGDAVVLSVARALTS